MDEEKRRRLHALLDAILDRGSDKAIEAIRLDLEMVSWAVQVAERDWS